MVVRWWLLLCCLAASSWATDPDVGKKMYELVVEKGYPCERHFATTPDGYILGMFRIPAGRGNSRSTADDTKPVVYLNHALLDSSFAYVCNSPTESLGFILADAGYDVWFGNNRGNTYSTNHTTLDTKSAAFWNFTWDEMALLDLPTHLGYVLNTTGAAKLSYVGHSQGTIQAFAGFSRLQYLAERVDVFAALAPVAYVHNQRGFLLNMIADLGADKLFQALGVKEFLPSGFITKFAPWICNLLPSICDDFIELIVGPSNHMNKSRIEVYVSQTPAGTSVKNMVHWGQGIRSENFRQYDYGSAEKNIAAYGQATPPDYRLQDIKTPVVLYAGADDYLADPKDVDTLTESLAPGILVKRLDIPSYAHLDFTWAVDAATVVYADLLKVIASAKLNETVVEQI